jgi:hypothetical protein
MHRGIVQGLKSTLFPTARVKETCQNLFRLTDMMYSYSTLKGALKRGDNAGHYE